MSYGNHDSRGPDYVAIAKEFRQNPTVAEKLLWERMRCRRLGGFKFRRQHVLRDRILDFYCREAFLIIEVDGDAHRDPQQQVRDHDRDMEFALVGYRTVRFSNQQVQFDTSRVCEQILDAVYQSIEKQRSPIPPQT